MSFPIQKADFPISDAVNVYQMVLDIRIMLDLYFWMSWEKASPFTSDFGEQQVMLLRSKTRSHRRWDGLVKPVEEWTGSKSFPHQKCFQTYFLVNIAIDNGHVEIGSFPSDNYDFPELCKRLPEGSLLECFLGRINFSCFSMKVDEG